MKLHMSHILACSLIFAVALSKWTVIDEGKACEVNQEGITRTFGARGFSLETCKARCLETAGCKAVDYYRRSGWCNLYDRACSTPANSGHGASSWRRTYVTHGACDLGVRNDGAWFRWDWIGARTVATPAGCRQRCLDHPDCYYFNSFPN